MKRFLRWFIDFLDRKFPDKVVVRSEDYEKLHKSVIDHGIRLEIIKDTFANIEKAIENAQNAAINEGKREFENFTARNQVASAKLEADIAELKKQMNAVNLAVGFSVPKVGTLER